MYTPSTRSFRPTPIPFEKNFQVLPRVGPSHKDFCVSVLPRVNVNVTIPRQDSMIDVTLIFVEKRGYNYL